MGSVTAKTNNEMAIAALAKFLSLTPRAVAKRTVVAKVTSGG
jgi:cytochrome c-type biogenesis protein CcmH/NrfG